LFWVDLGGGGSIVLRGFISVERANAISETCISASNMTIIPVRSDWGKTGVPCIVVETEGPSWLMG